MENLILGLYVLSLIACCLCLWFWYELEHNKAYICYLKNEIDDLAQQLKELATKRR